MSDADATAMSDDIVDATVSLKRLSRSLMPAARKQHPSTCIRSDAMQAASAGNLTYKKNVGQNATKHTSLYNSDLALSEGDNGYLMGVSEGDGAFDARAHLQ